MISTNYHFFKNKEINIVVFLFLFSFFLRMPVVLLFGDQGLENEWEGLVYNLIVHGKLALDLDGLLLPNLYMPPLYAYYLYFFSFFGLGDQNYILLILSSQILLASISVAVFYKINKLFFSQKISFYSSLLLSLIPVHVFACSQISSISLQIFLSILFFYFFFQLEKKKNILSIVLLSFTGGLLILLRGEFWAIFVLSLLYLFLFFKIPIKKISLIFLITLITISPYLIRNVLIFKKITVLESFGYNLWKGNHPAAMESSFVEGSEIMNENLMEKLNAIPKDKFWRINFDKMYLEEAITNIMKEPTGHLIFFFKKTISFLFISNKSHDPRYSNPLHYLPLLLLGITSLMGIILSDKKSYQLNYLIFIFLLNIIIFSTVSIMSRYKLIILPLQIIFTNVLVERIREKFFYQRKNN